MSLTNANIRAGADKSLAQPTFRCRRTESIVSLERGVCVHVPNFKSFLVTEAERKRVRRRARVKQHRDASCHEDFFFLQGKAPKEIHAVLTEFKPPESGDSSGICKERNEDNFFFSRKTTILCLT